MRTLVTGGAGFIGSHLVRRLLEQGQDVVVLDSYEDQVHGAEVPTPPHGVTQVEGDVGDPAVLDKALEGVEQVVHLAAAVGVGQSMYEIARYVRTNTLSTATFLERLVARDERPRRMVVASSMSIYGEGAYECPEHGPVLAYPRSADQLAARRWECLCPRCQRELRAVGTAESKPLIPTSVYAVTKRDHEELCLIVGAAYEIPTVALRFFNVYGPGQALSNPYTGVAAIFAARLLNRRPPLIFEDGLQTRDFIHVSDIVDGILLALESPSASGQAINLGTGHPTSVETVAEVLGDALDVAVEPERTDQFRAGDIRHCYADVVVARELLGFEAKVAFRDGMTELAGWLADQPAVDRVDQATSELTARGLAR